MLSVFAIFSAKNLQFDYDFEAFFPNEDRELEVYHNYREKFDYDNEFVLIAIENRSGVFQERFLNEIESLTNSLKNLKYVEQVVSPTNLKKIDLAELIPVKKTVLHKDDIELIKEDSVRIYKSGNFVGTFFPQDGKSLSIYVKTQNQLSKVKSDSLANSIIYELNKFKFDEIHYVGRIFAQKVYLENLQNEFVTFFLISFGLIVLFLWLSFRQLIGVLIPVFIVLIAILWTLALMNLFNKPIDLMTVMLPTMMFVAGMSDVIHFFSKYYDELNNGKKPNEIYPILFKEVGLPTFLTTLTTVVGFLSLMLSSIKPIRDFGMYTSIGVTIALLLSYTLLPALLTLINPKPKNKQQLKSNMLQVLMQKIIHLILRKRLAISIIAILVSVLSIFGMFKVRVNNILLEDLTDKVKIKQDFNFFDEKYSGVRPFELDVKCVGDNVIWDKQTFKQLIQIDSFVRKEFNSGFVASMPQMFYLMKDKSSHERLYQNNEDLNELIKMIRDNKNNRELKKLMTSDGKETRISAKIRDIGSIEVNKKVKKLKKFINTNIDNKILKFEVTGAAHLVDRNNQYMVKSMALGFLLSVIVISVLTFLLHRNWKMVIVFSIPNLLPLITIAGIMGYFGIELKAATALVFSIAFGIATDDTIHFISRLKIEMQKGKSLLYAFKRTYFETGRPIILTTFVLCGGFIALMTSSFMSTYYFGLLICVTIIVALLSDLFVLPVLLFWLYGKRK
ncbi:MAG: RND family transporter [Bacteroidia bacterium]